MNAAVRVGLFFIVAICLIVVALLVLIARGRPDVPEADDALDLFRGPDEEWRR